MRPHILIVDDAEDQLQLMRLVFRMVDPSLHIVTAGSGDEALNVLHSTQTSLPKVILLDLRMPGKDGQEVLAEIKSSDHLRGIPVCVFSNGDIHKDICECYEKGASFYFKKPSGLQNMREFAKIFNVLWFKLASHC
ncbi:MAG: response regulator [Oligoflexales bacterium]